MSSFASSLRNAFNSANVGFEILPKRNMIWKEFVLEMSGSDLWSDAKTESANHTSVSCRMDSTNSSSTYSTASSSSSNSDICAEECELQMASSSLSPHGREGICNLQNMCKHFLKNIIDNNECVIRITLIASELATDSTSISNIENQRVWLREMIEWAVLNDIVRPYHSSINFDGQAISLYYQDRSLVPIFTQCKYKVYTMDPARQLYTREKCDSASISAKELLSHMLHGVDNTGNVRIWPAEQILVQVFYRNEEIQKLFNLHRTKEVKNNDTSSNSKQKKRILELGGGMTALFGMAVASLHLADDIVVTDGHPDCVLNQNVCIEMNKQKGRLNSSDINIVAEVLRWSINDSAGDLVKIFENRNISSFDTVVACDCLFFEEFHDALLDILLLSLGCQSTQSILGSQTSNVVVESHATEESALNNTFDKDKTVVLFQPSRGGSMERFLPKATPFFNVNIIQDYDNEMSQLRAQYLTCPTSFKYRDENHFPIMIILHPLLFIHN